VSISLVHFKVVQIDEVSILGTEMPPSLLWQKSKPFGVLAGRYRISFKCVLIRESKSLTVVTGGEASEVA
jgi:hypothetical protein